MARIYYRPQEAGSALTPGGSLTLPESEARRLHKVLRMRAGDTLSIFDGDAEYSAVIRSITTKSAEIELTDKIERDTEPTIRILLGQGLPKGEKLEWALQKATELGVTGFIPVVLERSVRRPKAESETKTVSRMESIAAEAAAQSGRIRPPEVHGFTDLAGFIEAARGDELKLVPYESELTRGMGITLEAAEGVRSIAVLVGTEGGLTDGEVDTLAEAGFVSVRMGPRILRTETAGVAAVALLQFALGDLGGA